MKRYERVLPEDEQKVSAETAAVASENPTLTCVFVEYAEFIQYLRKEISSPREIEATLLCGINNPSDQSYQNASTLIRELFNANDDEAKAFIEDFMTGDLPLTDTDLTLTSGEFLVTILWLSGRIDLIHHILDQYLHQSDENIVEKYQAAIRILSDNTLYPSMRGLSKLPKGSNWPSEATYLRKTAREIQSNLEQRKAEMLASFELVIKNEILTPQRQDQNQVQEIFSPEDDFIAIEADDIQNVEVKKGKSKKGFRSWF